VFILFPKHTPPTSLYDVRRNQFTSYEENQFHSKRGFSKDKVRYEFKLRKPKYTTHILWTGFVPEACRLFCV
jgi:hypothetical protein